METAFLWNIILTLIIAPLGWFMTGLHKELGRVNILLNRTREDYMRRTDHSEETDRILKHLCRLEDKIDRLVERKE